MLGKHSNDYHNNDGKHKTFIQWRSSVTICQLEFVTLVYVLWFVTMWNWPFDLVVALEKQFDLGSRYETLVCFMKFQEWNI